MKVGNWKLEGITERLPMENFRKGVASPAAAIRNGVAGYLFTADAEILYIQFCVPRDWNGKSDLVLILHCVLNADEAVNDIIDWETSVVSVANHEDVDTAGVQTPGASHSIEGYNGAGVLHQVLVVLDYDDATCPIAPSDNVSVTLSRTANVGAGGYVAGVIVIDICVKYDM